MNFSIKPLTDTCVSALNKGLSFAPTSTTNDFDTIIDLQKFFRTLRLREFFQSYHSPKGETQVDNQDTNEQPTSPVTNPPGKPITPFKKKSAFSPPRGRSASLDTYCRLVDQDV